MAQNLWEISRRWNCEIHGLDIDREALDQAAKRHLIHVPPGEAKRHDLRELKRIGRGQL